jgi:GMP synthase (glutamine-hydrolysing)
MKHKVLIIDFGSQYTQLIARRVREQHVYCEIVPYYSALEHLDEQIGGIILSGSPCSVNDAEAPDIDLDKFPVDLPILAVCYGAQLLAKKFAGRVASSDKREYGRARLNPDRASKLLHGIPEGSQVWMSHGDTITTLPTDYELIGSTESVSVAAFQHLKKPIFGLQFHPEVTHSLDGAMILQNFLHEICHIPPSWTPAAFIEETVAEIQQQVGDARVICGLSGELTPPWLLRSSTGPSGTAFTAFSLTMDYCAKMSLCRYWTNTSTWD